MTAFVSALPDPVHARGLVAITGPGGITLSPPCRFVDGLAERDARACEQQARDWLTRVIGQHGDVRGVGDATHMPSEDCVAVTAVVEIWVPVGTGREL